MDINHSYWEENSNIQHLKYESCNSNDGEPTRLKDEPLYRCCDSNLNFATVACSEDDSEYSQYKKSKVSRQDPMSHRIIEKRRRDRMNNCLADLSRLIPAEYLKKGRGRIEKTEIIEMAIRHIKYLQQAHRTSGREQADRSHGQEQYRLGYQECMSETMRFLVEVEGYFARESLCVRLINHLQKHCDNLIFRERMTTGTKGPQIDKDYAPTTPVPTVTRNQSSEMFENGAGSQLRDMLTGNVIKDEIRMSVSPQILRPISPCIRINNEEIIVPTAVGNIPRLPTPEHEKLIQFKPQMEEILECQKNRQDVSNIQPKQRSRNTSENEIYSNGVSLYKFKNNIKQRFSQDLNAESNQNSKIFKRRKLAESTRRNSGTTENYSSENHSSPIDGSQCSPPSSELYRISSESENARISPTGSSVSDIRQTNRYMQLKPHNIQKESNGYGRYSPPQKNGSIVSQNNDLERANFSVPIFALHAKGSFYVPLTIDYHTLVPYLQHHNMLDTLPNVHNIILHPVTINVNFQSNYFSSANATNVKANKHKIEAQNGWH